MGMILKFVYKGYRAEYYYWEFIIIIKKFFLIFIGSFTEFFDTDSKATVLLIVVSIFLLFQTRIKPYESQYLNNIEFLSLLVTFLSANVGIMLYSDDMKKISFFFLIGLISFNSVFILYWMYVFYKHQKDVKSRTKVNPVVLN
jgi:hypothetical protein